MTQERIPRILLTTEEAARALSVGRTKIYELIQKGQLHSLKLGGHRRIPVSALEDFVNRCLEEQDVA